MAAEFDCVIRNGTVVDGTGREPVVADVAIRGGRIAEIGKVGEVVRQPLHPYAKGLMAAIPTLEGRIARLAQISGSMPRLSAIPRGCAFNPRCPEAFDRCRIERPPLLTVGGRSAACWLYDSRAPAAAMEIVS